MVHGAGCSDAEYAHEKAATAIGHRETPAKAQWDSQISTADNFPSAVRMLGAWLPGTRNPDPQAPAPSQPELHPPARCASLGAAGGWGHSGSTAREYSAETASVQPLACASSEAPKLPASNAPFLTMTCLLGSGCRGRTGPQNCPRQRGFNVWPGWPGPQPFHTCAHTHTGTRTLTGHTAHVTKKAEKDKGAERRWTSRDPQDTGH